MRDTRTMRVMGTLLAGAALSACGDAGRAPERFARYDTVVVDVAGPMAAEAPATFRDYRFQVSFTHDSGKTFAVPGFFAADGDAAVTGATSGDVWRARFTPGLAGEWHWEADFRTGTDVALSRDVAGEEVGPDGRTGRFVVEDRIGERGGRLVYDGSRYLRDAATGRPFIKTGAGSPENLLAFDGFDGTRDLGGTPFPALGDDQLHAFAPHARDAEPDDPTWGGRGANILGLVNYLGASGVNAQYMVTMNVRGDGQDVWPWVEPDARDVFDVSKLAQWNRVFEHMDARGVMKDFVLTETENESLFEADELGITGEGFADTRKLYYREMVARFGHLRRVTWNLGEENGVVGNSGEDPWRQPTSAGQRAAFAGYIDALDDYDHPVVSHNWPDAEEAAYGGLLGKPSFYGISLQAHHDYADKITTWLDLSAEAGRQWLVFLDEPLGWEFGARPDADDPTQEVARREVLWPSLFAGVSGIDWYFGWQNNAPTSDLSNEDMRSRDVLWRQSRIAREFMETYLPFEEMRAGEAETPGTHLFEMPGAAYALYLPEGGYADVRLPAGNWEFGWFDPVDGGALQAVRRVGLARGGLVSTGAAPDARGEGADWVLLIRRVPDRG